MPDTMTALCLIGSTILIGYFAVCLIALAILIWGLGR